MKRDEAIGATLILLFGAVTVYFSLRMSIGTFRAAGSGLFPLGLGILLMGLSIVLFIKSYVQPLWEKKRASDVPRSAKQVILFTGAIALATLLFKPLGYPLVSFLLLLALLRILGMRNWVYSMTLSFLTATGAYLLFVLWLQIPLPKGFIGL